MKFLKANQGSDLETGRLSDAYAQLRGVSRAEAIYGIFAACFGKSVYQAEFQPKNLSLDYLVKTIEDTEKVTATGAEPARRWLDLVETNHRRMMDLDMAALKSRLRLGYAGLILAMVGMAAYLASAVIVVHSGRLSDTVVAVIYLALFAVYFVSGMAYFVLLARASRLWESRRAAAINLLVKSIYEAALTGEMPKS